MNRSQRRLHVGLWAVLIVIIVTTIVAALAVGARIERAVTAPPAAGVR